MTNMKFTPSELQSYLPFFIEDEYPKGKTKERGSAVVAIALFLVWVEENVKEKIK